MSNPASSPFTLAFTILATATGVLFFLSLPAIVQIWIEAAGLTEAAAGQVASVHLGALTLGSVAVSALLRRLQPGMLMAAGLALGALGNGALCFADNFAAIAKAAAASGLGSGLLYGAGAALIGRLPHAGRHFSALLICQVVLAAVMLWLFPGWDLGVGDNSLFLALAILMLAGLIASPLFPVAHGVATLGDGPVSQTDARLAGLLCLAAVAAFYLAVGLAWAFVARRGLEAGISDNLLGGVLSAANLLSLLGCVAAWLLAERGSPYRILGGALLMGALCFQVMSADLGPALFVAALALFLILWNLIDIFQLTALSDADPGGRYVALVPACQAIATAAGPAIGATLLQMGTGVGGLMVTCAAISLVAVCLVYLGARSRTAAALVGEI